MGHTDTTSPKRRPEPLCHSCRQQTLEIDMLIDGRPLTMRACSTCDTRTWFRDAMPSDFSAIISALSSSPARYRRDLGAVR